MKTRVISSAAAIVLLAAIVYMGRLAIGVAVFILAAAGIYELFKALSKDGLKPVYAVGYLACLPLLYLAVSDKLPQIAGTILPAVAIGVFALLVLLFCLLIFANGKYKMVDISVTLFGIMYVVYLFSFITLTRGMGNGYLYIWFIFIGAWATDIFAYFTGVTIGKTKILPRISPKKSLEGSIGGIVGCMLTMLLFGYFFESVLGVPLYHFAILGGICGVVSQVGDWAASAIKRAAGIKDFGSIMPGHGGVLDRLDSILFVAPVVYFYIYLFF